ncbi:MAG: ribonuclease HII [Halieaceae bacterium]|jgi:ribonuclease HII|nr:ribonuclease HII [Halieaceae bacterium]
MEPWEAARAALAPGACVVGVDEVGRGPLAGDVVAAAVCLSGVPPVAGLTDSKKLSPARREQLAATLHGSQALLALGRATATEIDELNILRASLLAMHRAVDALALTPDLVLVDGRHLPDWSYPAFAVVRGDSRVAEIAAASIIAKVQRDAEMRELHRRWPHYGFDRHMGYPTARHLQALREHGPCPEHRRSFAPVRAALHEPSKEDSA